MLTTALIPATDGSNDRLLVVLHGLGDSMEGWRFFPEELGFPWLSTLFVNAPDPYHGGFSWYDIYGDQGTGIRRSRIELSRVLDALPKAGFELEKTVLLGFSQGCVMTLDTGLRYPKKLAGLVGISGYVFEPDRLIEELSPVAREQKVLVTHGTEDPLLPLEPTRQQIHTLQRAGLKIRWEEYRKAHTLDGIRELKAIQQFIQDCLPS